MATCMRQPTPLMRAENMHSNVRANGTFSLSRSMCFEVAVLSPLAAARDAMDAAILTGETKE